MKVLAVIPARLASTRLPNKPLADICGKPMLRHVWEAVSKTREIDEVVIATDSPVIMEAAAAFGAEALLTSPQCQSGTDRVNEIMGRIKADIYLNVQGDEPLLGAEDLDALARAMKEHPEAGAGTLCAPISAREAEDANLVKVVMDHQDHALYFSRSPIPYPRDAENAEYFGHIGVYGYRPEALALFSALPYSALEAAEKLEQLRLLQAGIPIQCVRVKKMTRGVDTPKDLAAVRAILSDCDNLSGQPDFADIRLIITDVDGVLTDGGLYYDRDGEALKKFSARDGLGIMLAAKAGLKIAVASGRDSGALRARMRELGIELFETGNIDKGQACARLMQKAGLNAHQTLYMGDDLPDLEGFAQCALSAAPADAAPAVKAAADMVTAAKGGEGALREVIDRVLAVKK